MSNFFNQLASGNTAPMHQGMQCSVCPFPWTEEFVKDGEVVHYYETDEYPTEAFIPGRIEVWKAFFEKNINKVS